MQTEQNYKYHRLSFRSWDNIEGPEGWAVKDRKTGKVIFKGGGFDGSVDMLPVVREFLSNERVEAMLCAEIDRYFGAVVDVKGTPYKERNSE